MKKLKWIIMICLISGAFISQVYAETANVKMAYVDLSRLFDEYYKTKEYDKVLEAKHGEFEKQAKEKVEKIREAQGRLALLKEDKKEALTKEIEDMKAELLEFDRQEKTNLTKERNDKIREILLEIESVVSSYAEKEGYSIILNDRVLIYGDKSFDITEPILKKLNESEPKK